MRLISVSPKLTSNRVLLIIECVCVCVLHIRVMWAKIFAGRHGHVISQLAASWMVSCYQCHGPLRK